MTVKEEEVAHKDLVGGGETNLHSHAGGNGIDPKPFVAVDSTGNQAITGTEATVNLNSKPLDNAGYTLSANEIQVNQDGKYWVSYSVAYDITNTSGGNRGCVDCHLEDDSGGSFVDTPGSWSRVYHREAAGGSGLSAGCPMVLTNGKKARLRIKRAYGSTNIDTVANKVSISIIKIG